ncbi:HU family DNA-binding protein [Agarilytica rhodophyticola]|uniref:HU family DNA-binding protein n=1 Tax=Agarilytica rhodophyticola TaxID=1737490 RepID=UPI000B343978|nr:HU family DNA-binding protein [Agarilytica rhodophyticola]
MRKADLVNAVADIADLSLREADDAVSSVFEHITNALARGEPLNLIGFGSFNVKQRAARQGRNPKTGDLIEIAASKQVSFKAGKNLREHII